MLCLTSLLLPAALRAPPLRPCVDCCSAYAGCDDDDGAYGLCCPAGTTCEYCDERLACVNDTALHRCDDGASTPFTIAPNLLMGGLGILFAISVVQCACRRCGGPTRAQTRANELARELMTDGTNGTGADKRDAACEQEDLPPTYVDVLATDGALGRAATAEAAGGGGAA